MPPAQELVKGCDWWIPLGACCHAVTNHVFARTVVAVNKDACAFKNGNRILALTFSPGYIQMNVSCWGPPYQKLDVDEIREVFAHEFGHVIGIWHHVPSSCDKKVYEKERDKIDAKLQIRTYDGGRRLCGQALMNPFVGELGHITEVDKAAYGLRDQGCSALAHPSNCASADGGVPDANIPVPDAGTSGD